MLCPEVTGAPGILSTVPGIVLMAAVGNDPLYQRLLERGKGTYAFELIRTAMETNER